MNRSVKCIQSRIPICLALLILPVSVNYAQSVYGIHDLTHPTRESFLYGHNENLSQLSAGTITEDKNITLLGRALLGPATCATTKGNYAYVGAGGALVIFDISDPEHPTLVSRIYTSGVVEDLALLGDYAFVVTRYNGLWVFDISDPKNPRLVGYIYKGGRRIHIYDNYVYLISGNLEILDISNPENPRELGSFYGPEWGFRGDYAEDVVISGEYAYIACSDGPTPDANWGFWVADISDPAHPKGVGFCDPGYNTPVASVALLGNYVYIVSWQMTIIDVSDPENPYVASEEPFGGFDIFILNDTAYVAGCEFFVLNISNPLIPQLIGRGEHSGGTVHVQDNYAYLSVGYAGLRVIDISDIENQQLVAEYITGGWANDVSVADGYAYVTDPWLRVVDVSNPEATQELGYCETRGYDIEVANHFAYLASGSDGLRVVDVSDSQTPKEVGFPDTTSMYVGSFFIQDSLAFVVANPPGIRIYDISTPEHPNEICQYTVEGWVTDIYASDKYAYLSMFEEGLSILDVTNPREPKVVGSFGINGHSYVVAANDDYAFVGCFSVAHRKNGIMAIDISNLQIPEEVGFAGISGTAEEIFASDGFLYVTSEIGGLRVFDVSNPESPFLIGHYGMMGEGYHERGIYVSGDTIYLASDLGGLHVLKFTPPPPAKGDVNRDGTIAVADVMIVVHIIIWPAITWREYELWAADFNSDGEINALDIVGMIRQILSDNS